MKYTIPAKYRKTVYVVASALIGGALLFGVVTPDQISAATDNAVKIAGLLSALLALANVTPDQ